MDLPYQIKDRVTLMHRSQSNPFYCLWSNLYWKPTYVRTRKGVNEPQPWYRWSV